MPANGGWKSLNYFLVTDLIRPPESRIRLLDPHTINQIAAGEVVERPASVVKELVENALDAGATRISIELVGAGKERILVRDNGCGMTPQEARQALLRHATSKIHSVEDLARVGSLGFRGEAVPSIASVSRFRLETAVEDGARTCLVIEGGTIVSESSVPGPRGTEICVEDLFYNTPARLKFLKSDSSELNAILDFCGRYAMAYSKVAFSVTHGGNVLLQTSGLGDPFEAVCEIWNREYARAMVAAHTEGPRFSVSGYVSPPHLTRPTRAFQFIFVNGRPVKSRTLTVALDQAYRDLTPERRYPMVALWFEIDPELIDVNVSPTKSEVRFQHESLAFDALRTAVRTALLSEGMMPDASSIFNATQALKSVSEDRPILGLDPAQALLEDLRTRVFGEGTAAAADPFEAPSFAAVNQPVLGQSSVRFPFADLLDGLRVIGQAMNTFIIAETKRGLVIIDQHVAHERILYEYLCGLKGKHAVERQPLLVPQTLHLTRASALLLEERIQDIEDVGFRLERFGGESFLIREAPAALRGKDPVRVLQDLVDELVGTTYAKKIVPTREQIWITSSCRMAVKAGDPLSNAEMEKLIFDLAETENPYLCPHGRPITITLTTEDLLRKFYRA